MDKFNFELNKGANLSFQMLYTNNDNTIFDLTGYSARLQVRENYKSPNILISLTSPVWINIDIPLGKITVNFLPSHTASFDNSSKSYVYDLE